ncbi:MAG: AMP-binding protein [Hyphomicrobiales bacterium]|nr:AMP-binding protein [Hyphomicrobiales bacterium]
MGRRDAPWLDDVEAMDPAAVADLQRARLVAQMAWLQDRSEFYRRKLAAAGVAFADIRTADDLRRVPFTYKQELRDSLAERPPYGLHQAADLADIVQMQASSGTTGVPAFVALTAADLEAWSEMTARCLFACGLRPGDKVLHGFSMAKGFVGGIPIFQALQYMGCIDIPIGADGGIDRLLVAAQALRPEGIVGTPNFILHLAERAPDLIGCAAPDLGVRRIVVGGEPGGGIPAIRNRMQAAWNATVCELMGGTDLGCAYWAECDHQAGMHLVAPDHVLAELLDPETEEPVAWAEGARGELVYTGLTRRASPVLRFRSGDHVEVLGMGCACGRTGPRIRCFGRTDDMLIVRGVNVFPSAIQDIVASMRPDTNGVVRVLADFDGHTTQGNLKVLVERGPGRDPAGDATLREAVATRLRNTLSFKADVRILPADSFEKPGVQKVALTLRQAPSYLED